ncbi:MAG: winged helix-turn-helix transcriptional regulator [Steroidobacteraceae bacterium]|jgi:DNA-binding Lrp family transcriptional regulator
MELRTADHRILRELARDGRLSNVELARRVRMSESACLRRVRALEESGAIAGYRAVINPAALGKILSA